MDALINKSLQDKNAELKADENGNLIIVGKDGTNIFGSNNVQLTPQSFFDQTFAPILKVSGPPKPAPTPRQPDLSGNDKPNANADVIRSHNEQVMADFAKPQPSLI